MSEPEHPNVAFYRLPTGVDQSAHLEASRLHDQQRAGVSREDRT